MMKKIGIILATMMTASFAMESSKQNKHKLDDFTDWVIIPETEQDEPSMTSNAITNFPNTLTISPKAFTNWAEAAYTTCHDLFFFRPQSNEKEPITKNNYAPKFVYDIFIKILGFANKGGLDLKTYRREMFVCKEWRVLATDSITQLDIIELMKTTHHRKWTLLAHIIADYPLHRFPNLTTLTLDCSLRGLRWVEVYNKCQNPEERQFSKKSELFSKDGRLDAIDEENKQISKEIKAKLQDPHTRRISKLFSGLGAGGKVLWNYAWKFHITGVPFNHNKAKNLEDNRMITVEQQIMTTLLDFKNLTKLVLTPWDDINPYFVQDMPHLKNLAIISNREAYVIKGMSANIYLDALGNMQKDHGLKCLALNGNIFLSSFEGWSKFHKLKELHLVSNFFKNEPPKEEFSRITDTNQLNKILNSLVKNLPHIEKLSIGPRLDPNILLFKHLSELPNLSELGLLGCLLSNKELIEISKFENLKKLTIFGDTVITKELHPLIQPGNIIFDHFTSEDMDFFKQTRPDVDVKIMEERDEAGDIAVEIH